MTSRPQKQMTAIHILPIVSKSTSTKAMKFSQTAARSFGHIMSLLYFPVNGLVIFRFLLCAKCRFVAVAGLLSLKGASHYPT